MPPDPRPNPPRRILMIRPSALGDVARTVPALVSLRQAYPQAEIAWLVQDNYTDLLEAHPALTRAIAFPRQALSHWWRSFAGLRQFREFCHSLRAQQFDMVVDLQGLFRSGFLTRTTGARLRLGFANARELAWLGYNVRHPVDRKLHTVERMLGLLQAHGLPVVRDMRLYLRPADQIWFNQFATATGLIPGQYTLLAPTAQWLCKCWPMARYVELAQRLPELGAVGQRCVILAAPHEQNYVAPLTQALLAQAGRGVAPAQIQPTTTVGQMLALIAHAGLVVCNDSAPLHMAVAFNKPIATIFGPTDPALVGPYQRPDTVIQPENIRPDDMRRYRARRDDQTLIARVSVEQVWAKIRSQPGR